MIETDVPKRRFHLSKRNYQWLFFAGVALACLTIFLELGEDVWSKEGFPWDASIMLAIHAYSRPWLDYLMLAITETAGNYAVIGVIVLALWLWRGKAQLNALLLFFSFGGAVVFNSLLKLFFARPRPTIIPRLVVEGNYSFPSGHTIAAVALYGLLAVWLWQQRHWLWAILCGTWPLAVAISRIYLGVHYPSDVLASLTVGSLWVMAVVVVSGYLIKTPLYAKLTRN